jgi:hypothetical protein
LFYINYLLSPHPLLLHLNMSMPSNTDSQDVVQKWGWMWEIPPQADNMFETPLPIGAHFLAEVHRRLTRAQSHISTEDMADNADEPGALDHPFIKCHLLTCLIGDQLSAVGYDWGKNPFDLKKVSD